MKRASLCAIVCAVAGYCVAVWVGSSPPGDGNPWLQFLFAAALCPPAILIAMSATDPSAGVIWFMMAPLNALLYGWAGYALWRKFGRK